MPSLKSKEKSRRVNEAIVEMKKRGLGQNQAADLFGVPRTTLKNRLSGLYSSDCPGRPKRFTDEEEQQIHDRIHEHIQSGILLSVKDCLDLVNKMFPPEKNQKPVTYSWWKIFSKRFNLHLKTMKAMAKQHQQQAITPETPIQICENLDALYENPSMLQSVEHCGDPKSEVVENEQKTEEDYSRSEKSNQLEVIVQREFDEVIGQGEVVEVTKNEESQNTISLENRLKLENDVGITASILMERLQELERKETEREERKEKRRRVMQAAAEVGTLFCVCKKNCLHGRCGCKTVGVQCSKRCKCSEGCKNC